MLKPNRYRLKHKKIKIFKEQETASGTVKIYITPNGKTINAYARQLSAAERIDADGVKNSSTYEFVIHKRNVQEDMFIEFDPGFGERVYQIEAVDLLEFLDGEIYIRAYEVNKKTYSEIRWS